MRVRRLGWILASLVLLGGNCSRARVDSMNEMNTGVELAQQKRLTQAVEHLERATALDPSNDQAFHLLGTVQGELGSFTAAREALERAIAVKGDVAGYHEKLGTVLMQLEDWTAAQAALQRALDLDKSLFKAHYKLGRIYEEIENRQAALYQYTDAIKKGPRFLSAYSALGRMYADLRYPDQAVQVLTEGLKVAMVPEEEANLHHLLGTVYQQQHKLDQAVSEFEAALSRVPGMPDALFSLGWTYSLQGNEEEAERYLKKFLMMAGGNAPEHYVKAARDRIAELKTETP